MGERPRSIGRARRVPIGGGVELALTEYGPGEAPPLVLLHGIGSRGVSWWPVLDELAAEYRLVVLDLRGHGASAAPPAGYLLPDYAADLSALIEALGLDRPRLLGHSLGGLVALEWATLQPDRAVAIAVEDSPLRSEPGILETFDGWQRLAALPPEQVVAYYRSEHPTWSEEECRRRAESITATAPAVFAELRAETAARLLTGRPDRFAELAAIRSPTLLVRGDPAIGGMVSDEDAGRFRRVVPGGSVRRVPGAGHAIHREQPAAFLAAVLPFLAGAAG